jgi:hypothetical protein
VPCTWSWCSEVKNKWSGNSVPPFCLHCLYWDCTFRLLLPQKFEATEHKSETVPVGPVFSNVLNFSPNYPLFSDPGGRAIQGVGLRRLVCWDYGFESPRWHGCLPIVIDVCCQVEFSASGWSLVQRSPTVCVCVCHWVRSSVTVTLCTHNDYASDVRLERVPTVRNNLPNFYCIVKYTVPLRVWTDYRHEQGDISGSQIND